MCQERLRAKPLTFDPSLIELAELPQLTQLRFTMMDQVCSKQKAGSRVQTNGEHVVPGCDWFERGVSKKVKCQLAVQRDKGQG